MVQYVGREMEEEKSLDNKRFIQNLPQFITTVDINQYLIHKLISTW